ncbi:MAG: hypothetical protein WAW86_06065 [Gammaproteobacteria bacterium]
MKVVTRLVSLLLPAALMSCSYITPPKVIQSRDDQYLTARSVAPLKAPPGISSDAFHNNYPIPDHVYPEASKRVSIVPPGLNS